MAVLCMMAAPNAYLKPCIGNSAAQPHACRERLVLGPHPVGQPHLKGVLRIVPEPKLLRVVGRHDACWKFLPKTPAHRCYRSDLQRLGCIRQTVLSTAACCAEAVGAGARILRVGCQLAPHTVCATAPSCVVCVQCTRLAYLVCRGVMGTTVN